MILALFTKIDPDQKLQHDTEAKLRARRRDRDGTAEELRTVEAKIVEREEASRVLVAEGGFADPKLTIIENETRAAQIRAASLRGGLDRIDADIAGLEREVDRIVDKRCRAETSIAVNAMADELAEAQAAFTKAAQRLEVAARQSGLLIPEGRAVAEFTLSALMQLPPAVEMVTAALRQHARGVLSGHAPASLPRPAAEPVKLEIVPPMPTLSLFAAKKLKYLDAVGAVVVVGAYHQHAFPQALGELALRTNVAVALNDKRVRDLQAAGLGTVGTPDEASCEWLGKPGREAPERFAKPGGPPIHSSLTSFTPSGDGPFTVVDRGPPITGTLPSQPLAVGSRKLDTEG
jgi:hypothetical protein